MRTHNDANATVGQHPLGYALTIGYVGPPRWGSMDSQEASMSASGPLIIAHRGASGLVPFDNTMEAFEKAIEVGAPMVEFDIRRTKDRTLVCYHDADIDGAPLSELSFDELQVRAKGLGFEVPRLRDMLRACRGRITFDVEIKDTGYEAQILDVLCSELYPKEFVVKSFHDKTVKEVKQLNEQVRTGLLVGIDKPDNALRTRLREVLPEVRMAQTGADFVSPHYKLVRFGFVPRMHRLGYKVFVWTVDDPELMASLIRKGVDAIITNRPDIGLDLLRRVA